MQKIQLVLKKHSTTFLLPKDKVRAKRDIIVDVVAPSCQLNWIKITVWTPAQKCLRTVERRLSFTFNTRWLDSFASRMQVNLRWDYSSQEILIQNIFSTLEVSFIKRGHWSFCVKNFRKNVKGIHFITQSEMKFIRLTFIKVYFKMEKLY